jgi:hypothetical protein
LTTVGPFAELHQVQSSQSETELAEAARLNAQATFRNSEILAQNQAEADAAWVGNGLRLGGEQVFACLRGRSNRGVTRSAVVSLCTRSEMPSLTQQMHKLRLNNRPPAWPVSRL